MVEVGDRAARPPTRLGPCSSCVYWGAGAGSGLPAGLGHCRVGPPTMVGASWQQVVKAGQVPPMAVSTAKWPVCSAGDWCGSWAGA